LTVIENIYIIDKIDKKKKIEKKKKRNTCAPPATGGLESRFSRDRKIGFSVLFGDFGQKITDFGQKSPK